MQKAFHAWAQPGFAPFRLDYDADRIDALAKERALEWSRIGGAAFLTVDERREAAGYGPMGSHAKYSPDQPRVSAGSPEGGQWTSGDGSGGGDLVQVALNTIANVVGDAGAILVGESDRDRYSVDLQAEEGYGHTIRDHVGKENSDLVAALERKRFRIGLPFIGLIAYEPAVGSFDSRESANDFVNRVIEANQDRVDAVAEGRRNEVTLEKMFGFRTGKEAFLESGMSEPIVRWTFGVRVVLHADPTSDRGYRVRTAFPVNKRASQ